MPTEPVYRAADERYDAMTYRRSGVNHFPAT